MDDHHKLLEFLHQAEKLKSTLRHNWTTSGRQEDSSQHSWRAALFFLTAQEIFHFDVDAYKTLAMLLIHDIAESKYGDIPGFKKDTNPKEHAEHKAREKLAAKAIFNLLPKDAAEKYISLEEEFDSAQTKEAKLAHAIEKIESQLQHLESNKKYWGEDEKGEHMLHYPDKAINSLNNEEIRKIWKIIYDDIYRLTYQE
jgi:putative hydrolases of HD superfamily